MKIDPTPVPLRVLRVKFEKNGLSVHFFVASTSLEYCTVLETKTKRAFPWFQCKFESIGIKESSVYRFKDCTVVRKGFSDVGCARSGTKGR